FEKAPQRWDNLARMHQLYLAGHLIQGAVAHHRATGKTTLLDVATRFADLICATFTPASPGTDGHEEIELALAELYRHTGERRHLDQALFFLDLRGRTPPVLDGSEYLQDHLPVRAQREIVGHAVRATYLAIGMADTYAETGDPGLWSAVRALWDSAFERKAYVTGGLGARRQGEAFGDDYELPNDTAYAETCAAIGGFLWNWRMLHLDPDTTSRARYADWMEIALYNGILSGLSLDGTHYFYPNPLANDGSHRRTEWFSTACCPPNVARLLLSLPGYIAGLSDDAFWLHHFLPGDLRIARGEREVHARIETDYPWGERVRLEITRLSRPSVRAALNVRIPHWCEGATLHVNGAPAHVAAPAGRYASLAREWRQGDVFELHLPLTPRRIHSPPQVAANAGRVALARGPLVYCAEGVDNPGVDLASAPVPATAALSARPQTLLGLGPIVTLQAGDLTAIPYHLWAHRAPGPMHVWLRES
ncbi:MAG TPA: beta-L-arabinofuranosidase domain-containing protein, partial [Chloroflexota bacterium]|nr:beta-L-arabinofuranosidase domain-containing protein [Chloroflexota bacterium]